MEEERHGLNQSQKQSSNRKNTERQNIFNRA